MENKLKKLLADYQGKLKEINNKIEYAQQHDEIDFPYYVTKGYYEEFISDIEALLKD